jgi:release factor glutamine methyltransferase
VERQGRTAVECHIEENMDSDFAALVRLGKHLQAGHYRFTTITPISHGTVQKRRASGLAESLTDIFGWSLPFSARAFPLVAEMLGDAGELDEASDFLCSRVRFSTLGEQLFVHSSYPTQAENAVFFGPDTYRFARAIRQFMPSGEHRPARIIDLGCGTGAGGIYAASILSGDRPELVLADINEAALRYCRVNCALNGSQQLTTIVQSDLFKQIDGRSDLIVSNPPYLVDPAARAYRHGGPRGFDLSLRIAEESLDRLAPRGRLILYTGTPVVDGHDQFLEALSKSFAARAQPFCYEEIDPDVFGEELAGETYGHADRLAAVVAVADALQ